MESINQVAAAAAKAVWGDENAHKEPVSGVKGDVSKGEPYDAGNLEPARQEQVEHSLEGRNNNNNNNNNENSNISSLTENPSSVPQKATGENEYLPLSAEENRSSAPFSTEKESGTGFTENTPSYTRENDYIPKSTTENTMPGSYETSTPERTSQSTTGLGGDTATTSTDFSDKPARRNEGLEGEGFGSRPSEGLDSRPSEKLESQRSEGLQSEGFTANPEQTASSNDASDSRRTHVPEPTSLESKDKQKAQDEESQGTGQEYVRSSGFAADGGDFDATKPGAGREADRLWEEKGHHPDDEGHGHGSKDKPSLGHRLKEKLHIHKE